MTSARAIPEIRRILAENPDTRVRYIDAVAPESLYLSAVGDVHVLYVNGIHRDLVAELQPPAD